MTKPAADALDVRPRDHLLNPDVWATALLVLLGILFFADPLFSSKNFYFRDILNFHYPLRKILIDSCARGELPLWNPFVYLGQPMLANPNYMALYPTNLLHLLLPFNYAFKLHFILHPVLAGVGLFFLLRRLGQTVVPALAGSIAYEFSGTVLSFLNLYNIIPAVALLPWIGWAFVGAIEKDWLRRSVGFGVLLALQVIALEPLTFFCSVCLLVGLAIHHCLESTDGIRSIARPVRIGVVGGILGLGLASVQVLPTLELLPLSSRGSGFAFRDTASWSIHPLDLLNTIVPNLFGNYYQIGFASSWGESLHEGREGYLVSCFLGTTTLLLAILSFWSRRKRLQATFAAMAAVSTALALGSHNPLNQWLFNNVAIFRLGRFPSKYILLSTLSIAILASLGAEVMLNAGKLGKWSRRWVLGVGGCFVVAGIISLACLLSWPLHVVELERWIRAVDSTVAATTTKNMPAILAQLQRSLLASSAFLMLGGAMALAAQFWRRTLLMGSLMLLLIAAELLPANLRLAPLISDADVSFVPEVNRFLSPGGSREPYRVAPPTLLKQIADLNITVPNLSSAWLTLFYKMSGQPFYGIMNGIQYSLDSPVDYLSTEESTALWRLCSSLPESAGMSMLAKLNSPVILAVGELRDPRLRSMASFGLRSSSTLNVYWLGNAVSRAFFAPNVEKAASHPDALQRFIRPDFPFGNTVVLEDPGVPPVTGSVMSGSVKIDRYENQRVSCRVEAGGAGYLVLLDSFYPGWDAYLDGKRVEVLRADYAFRAVAVPEGNHQVEFRYRPRSFFLGLTISLVTLVSGTLCAVRRVN